MSLQKIINIAETIGINRRRTVGVQTTRNSIVRTSETPTRVPWRFQVKVGKLMRYEQARAILEEIDRLDRNVPEVITMSNNSNLSWMFAYQGDMSNSTINNIRVDSFSGNQLVLKTISGINVGQAMFKAGDFIQVGSYPYPFTVVSDVLRTSASTETVTVHRGNFISDSVVNQTITVGNAVTFKMLCMNMPTYTLTPGGSTALVQWDSDFQLYEYTGDQV